MLGCGNLSGGSSSVHGAGVATILRPPGNRITQCVVDLKNSRPRNAGAPFDRDGKASPASLKSPWRHVEKYRARTRQLGARIGRRFQSCLQGSEIAASASAILRAPVERASQPRAARQSGEGCRGRRTQGRKRCPASPANKARSGSPGDASPATARAESSGQNAQGKEVPGQMDHGLEEFVGQRPPILHQWIQEVLIGTSVPSQSLRRLGNGTPQ